VSTGVHQPAQLDPQLASVQQIRAQVESLAVDAHLAATQPPEPASYGLLTAPREAFANLVSTIESLLARLKPDATVHTTLNGASARTIINYTGRAFTVVSPNLTPALEQNHSASLQQTYALRGAATGALAAAASTTLALLATAANPLCLPHALSTAVSLKAALDRLASALETTGQAA